MNKKIYIVYYYDQGDCQYLHGVYGNEAYARVAANLIDRDTDHYAIVMETDLLSGVLLDIPPFLDSAHEGKEKKTKTDIGKL